MTKSHLTAHMLAAVACVAALSACSEDKKARVEQRVVEKAHDPGACPALADGHYRLSNAAAERPLFVDISRNNGRELQVQFDSNEKYLVNGKEQPKPDGSKFSLGCIANSVRVAGTDAKGQRTKLTIVPTQKGLNVQETEPSKLLATYEKTSIIGTAVDKAGRAIDQQNPPSGIPSPDNVKK